MTPPTDRIELNIAIAAVHRALSICRTRPSVNISRPGSNIRSNGLGIRGIASRLALIVAAACFGESTSLADVEPAQSFEKVATRVSPLIEYELDDKKIPSIAVAVVDSDRIVWARGFGTAQPDANVAATAQSVYRVGSVSKLFTDIAVMQLVEQGKLSLDAPITTYLPQFTPQNDFDEPVTLRMLMSHRSGLVRESPVGHYFDALEPSLKETVLSLNSTSVVYPPRSRTKYSNAGVSVVGYLLEATQQQSFEECIVASVLQPLGMSDSDFRFSESVEKNLAWAEMRTYDGRRFEAPNLQLGTSPAGNLYSTVEDLGRFMICLFNNGQTQTGQLLQRETLHSMMTPQFDEDASFGLGFSLSDLDGHRQVGHGGAVYGYSTQLSALPDEKLGVVVVAALDGANGTTRRISNEILRSMVALKSGKELEPIPLAGPVPEELSRRFDGRYSHGDEVIELLERDGNLDLHRGSYRYSLRSLANDFVIDDPLRYGPHIERINADVLQIEGDRFRRLPQTKPEPIPSRWQGLIGEYGWDHNILYILEDGGQLFALIEWFYYYPLEELGRDEFAFPDYGLYHGEKLYFERDEHDRATIVNAAEVVFPRRAVGTLDGATFQIDPIKPIDQLRETAMDASPPAESGEFRRADLVEPTLIDDSIKLDVRYASTNNFMGAVFYQQPRAFLQRPAAEALVRVHRKLQPQGYGLLIHDAYRPWFVTKMFWDATPQDMKIFVANPENGSRHNRGCAVDLTLYHLSNGEPVDMVAGYDEFSTRSFPDYPGGTALQRHHRELLRDAMESEGFTIYEFEWWHFDYKDWQRYRIGNIRFEDINTSGGDD